MKKNLLFICSFLIVICCFADKTKFPQDFKPQAQGQNISFSENKGQVSDQYYKPRPDVLFSGSANGMVFHLRNNGISYQLNRVDSWKDLPSPTLPEGEMEEQVPDQTTIYRLDINWLNCNISAPIKTGEALSGYNNYYSEVCPNGVHHVTSYKEVTYQNIYKGIDLKWYEKNSNLKYDYIIAAGADYKQIQLEVKGAEKISLNSNGELIIKTLLGTIIEQAPLVKQNGKILKSKWIINNHILSYEIENIDPRVEFIIDPLVRAWGTYYGGIGNDFGMGCSTDLNNNVYMTGYTNSNGGVSIATVGSHQTINGGGTADAFIAKFNSNGTRLWATYYGGTGFDQGWSCATDANLNVYMAGFTESNAGTVIATIGSHQPTHGGGTYDACLVKFDTNGLRLWGTYYGGTGTDERAHSCATDATGNVYIAGRTDSNTGTVIATIGSHQPANGGAADGFLAKFNSNGARLWATYYGGTGGEFGYSCTVDSSGNIYLAGSTSSTLGAVIATVGSHQPINGGGGVDAFIVKFDPNGVRQWGTYYGGTLSDDGNSCVADALGNVYMAGMTTSTFSTVIATNGSHQPANGGGTNDAYLVKFNTNGVRQWGTYYGGSADDRGRSCVTDTSGNIYMTGYTSSNSGTAIATGDSYQAAYGGGIYDAYLVKFDPNGVRQWGSYYGGAGDDRGWSCVRDAGNNIFIAGQSSSNTSTIVASAGSHQPANGGGADGLLVKYSDCFTPNPVNTTPIGNQTICINNSATLTANGTGTISWFATPTSSTVLSSSTVYITPTLSSGTYTFYAEDFTCIPSATRAAITITVSVCTGINGQVNILDDLYVYPNPNAGEFVVELKNGSIKNIEVYDLLGKVVFVTSSGEDKKEINIKHLAGGIYYLKVESAYRSKLTKMIKQ